MENLRPPRTQAHLRRLGYEICEKWPLESAGINRGEVWGYWFAPVTGLRYYIPQTRWSITVEGLFRFLGGVNGLTGSGSDWTVNETPHAGLSGGWIYVPLGVVAIGYRF